MADMLSPLGDAHRPGRHGKLAGGPRVTLSLERPGSIVEIRAFPGMETAFLASVKRASGLGLSAAPGAGAAKGARAAFGIGPGRHLVVDRAEGLAARLSAEIADETGTVTELTHGRSAFRIEGEAAGWVLAKLFALDFSISAFPVREGRATSHHDILAAIRRGGETAFEVYVFRSFARDFWRHLCENAEEVGYEVR